ncbi:hypothetical protein DSC45_26890 [Streptomyces sp. YIM 130001]|uniref:hypothetical protein n=1 Tax=Streptomyces sp. YIM 130001 TaxID=2259644 RepID=UPI000E654FB9|nr:hypothetical protein [Streptomyces sp. YIM 130001]RII11929.1 hypothetical protein DSC45_26890 [Streptomyces sp. YIM 130001]
MTTTQKLVWPHEEDEQWAAAVQLRLALDQHAPVDIAHEVLAEAHDAVTEAGRSAPDLFGDPAEYARAAADERLGEEYRAQRDSHGTTPGERLTAALATLGFVGIIVPVLRWINEGLWWQVSWPSLAGFATVVAVAVLVSFALALRAAGRIAGTWICAAGAVVVMGAGAAAAGLLPDGTLFDFPLPLLAAAGGATLVGAVMFPDATVDRWFTQSCRGSDERWLSHAEGLLRGRHAMSAAEARAHIQEARQHLAASGESAEDAFGEAEVYAMHLSEGPRREQRLARRNLYGATAFALLVAVSFADDLRDPDPTSPWFWLTTAAAAYFVWYVARGWRRAFTTAAPKRPTRDTEPGKL